MGEPSISVPFRESRCQPSFGLRVLDGLRVPGPWSGLAGQLVVCYENDLHLGIGKLTVHARGVVSRVDGEFSH
jgi:hypothetical protein